MKNTILLGVASALLTGLMIGVQSALSNRSGQWIGSLRTGLFTNLFGGVTALLVLGVALAARWLTWQNLPQKALATLIGAGVLGVFIIMGVAFSLRYTGVVAGLGTIILGQMLVSSLIDASGWIGLERIPFTWQRALGLLLMALAVYLLLPRKGG